jgi:hypothetical protein
MIEAAKETIDLTPIWRGEIVISNVPVAQPKPSQPDAPATQKQ